MNKTILSAFILLSAMLFFSTCKKNPVGPEITANVQLSVDYVTCTEVWLKIGFTDAPGGGDYKITRDGVTILSGTVSGTSTVVYDTTAQAKKSYTYVASRLASGQVKEISPPLSVLTLDSTSHNFTWQTFNFGGDVGGCLFRDVAIVSDTEAWVASEAYLKDSSGQLDPQVYNYASWNGVDWKLRKAPYYYQGQPYYNPIHAVYASATNDVWLGGNGLIHWDGGSFLPIDGINIIWGQYWMERIRQVESTLYVVGDGGNIAEYSGGNWLKLTSGTTVNIQDIWGIVDAQAGQSGILALGCNRFTNDGVAVLQLSGNSVTSVQTTGLPINASSVWSANGKEWYVCGDFLSKTRSLNSPWQRIPDVPFIYEECIRGNAPNDIFVVGDFGVVSHFNGSTWFTYPAMPGNYVGLATKGDLVIAVGYLSSGGVAGAATILMGRRN